MRTATRSLQARPVRVTLPLTEKEKLRRHMERAVERLIAAMDQLDGDADLEEEPDLEEQWDRELVCEDEGSYLFEGH